MIFLSLPGQFSKLDESNLSSIGFVSRAYSDRQVWYCVKNVQAVAEVLSTVSPIVELDHPAVYAMLKQLVLQQSSWQEPHLIAFQGARGAYSEMAIKQFFSSQDTQFLPCLQFRDAFEAVNSGKSRFAVLPIENALTGSIHENYDLLLAFPQLTIVGELLVRIRHHLFGLPGASLSDIKHVYSHPQGLLQCAAFLADYPSWEQIPFYDTAGSVEHIRDTGDKTNAAIAGVRAGEIYGVPVLAEGIETNQKNFTRFVVLARQNDENLPVKIAEQSFKASIVFSLPHKPGALLQAMQILGEKELNLCKIESRPIHGKPWEYSFYLDLDIGTAVDDFLQALQQLSAVADHIKLLGVYPKAL